MHELASEIRNKLVGLEGACVQRLAVDTAGTGLSEQDLLDALRQDLDLIATCLERQDAEPFLAAIDAHTQRWSQPRLVAEVLSALEDALMPLVAVTEDGLFLWRLFSCARQRGAVVAAVEQRKGQTGAGQAPDAFRTLMDSLPFGVVIIGRDKVVRHANAAALGVMGYNTEDEIVGELCHQTLCPADRDHCPILDFGREVDRSERVLVAKDGRRVPIIKSVVPIVLDGEEVLLEAFVDITESRQAQDELRASQRMLQLIMDNIPQTVFWKGQDLVYEGCNLAFAERRGLASADDVIGKTDYDLSSAEQAEMYRQDDSQVMETGIARLNYEEPQIAPDGSERWLQTSKIPLRDVEGNIRGVLGMYEDITDRKQASRALERLYERRSEQVRTSVEISQALAAVAALDELFRRVVTLIKERLEYYHVQIFRYEPALDAVVLVMGYGEIGEQMLMRGHSLPMRRGIVGTAAATGQAVLVPDTAQEPGWLSNPYLPDTKGELAVPILLRDQVLGIIDVQSDTRDALDQEDLLLLESISGPIALAIDATTLRQDMEANLRELRSVQQAASQEGWLAFREAGVLPEGYRFDRLAIQPSEGLASPEISRAVQSRQLVAPVEDSTERGIGVSPILVQNEPVGVLGLYEDPETPLTREELDLLQSVSEQVAAALETARLAAATQSALAEARTLYRFGELVSGETDVQAISEAVSEAVVGDLGYAMASLSVLEEDGEVLREVARAGDVGEDAPGSTSISDTQDIGVMAVRQRKPVVRNDMAADDRWRDTQPFGSAVAVPVMSEGEPIGVLSAYRPAAQTEISDEDLRILEAVGIQVVGAMQRAVLFQQTQEALDAADAATQRYLQDTWDAFLDGRTLESQGYVAGPDGVMLDQDLWSPEMAQALEQRESISVVTAGEDIDQPSALLAVPLRARGQIIGVVDLVKEGSEAGWSAGERELVEALVEQIGDSIEGERQFAQTQATLAETERMYQASQRISSAADQDSIVQVLLDVASTGGTSDQAAVFIFDRPVATGMPDSQTLAAYWDREGVAPPAPVGTRYGLQDYPLVYLVNRDEPFVVSDAEADARLDDVVQEGLRRLGFRGLTLIPISVGNEWLGYSAVFTRLPHTFAPGEMRVYESVADQAATALRSTWLYRDAQKRAQREELIREITSKMRGTPDLDTILNTAVQELGKALGVSRAFVRLSTGSESGESDVVSSDGAELAVD